MLSTHSEKGVTANDIDLAKTIDGLARAPAGVARGPGKRSAGCSRRRERTGASSTATRPRHTGRHAACG